MDDERLSDLMIHEYASYSPYNFHSELLFSRFTVQEWELNYCLCQPVVGFGFRLFLQMMLGSDYDILPIAHTIGYP